MKTLLFFCFMLISGYALSQLPPFPTIGQLPGSAYPVCGTFIFRQLIIPAGSGGTLSLPACGTVQMLNPYYYSFTCYTGGSFSLLITPIDSPQDFNWELFDITGHDPNDIFTNTSLEVIGNWSGTYGLTGTEAGGSSNTECPTDPTANVSAFSMMPNLVAGHHYLLLVCGYSPVQSNYKLSFPAGSAGITDFSLPQLASAFVGCDKKTITVVMTKQIRCQSLLADGSEFFVAGSSVSITGASGINCNSQFDLDTLLLTLSDTLVSGNYSLSAKAGTNNAALFDNCGTAVADGNNIPIVIIPVQNVSADFTYDIQYGCKYDTTIFSYSSVDGVNQWSWQIDSATNTAFEPTVIKSVFLPMDVVHIVSNGYCSDTVSKIINLDNVLKASFTSPNFACPKEAVAFTNTSQGKISSWLWNFGDGLSSDQQNPSAHFFPGTQRQEKYNVTLIARNDLGCSDTASSSLIRLQSCSIAVPNAFTPNGDGKNDYLYPLNAFSTTDLEFMIFNRYGQLVFETRDPARKWDGTINGVPQDFGVYIWTLRYTDGASGQKFFQRGTSVLIR